MTQLSRTSISTFGFEIYTFCFKNRFNYIYRVGSWRNKSKKNYMSWTEYVVCRMVWIQWLKFDIVWSVVDVSSAYESI